MFHGTQALNCAQCRRHPACSALLHRPEPSKPLTKGPPSLAGGGDPYDPSQEDPYDPSQEDPALAGALGSSLWEVEALRNHYCSQVSHTQNKQTIPGV